MEYNKKALLVISFGTSYGETRRKTLDAIEQDLREAFADYEFRRAYTSPTIIRILKNRDRMEVDNVEQALARLARDGYKTVVAQTTHVIHGFEYDKMMEMIARFSNRFETLVCGEPLLTGEEDYRQAARIMGKELAGYRGPGTDIMLMGHGTEHVANASYARLQQAFLQEGFDDFLVGTAEVSPTLDNMMKLARQHKSVKTVLTPFLVVAGNHAVRDMAGDGETSWKSRFEQEGYQVECVMKGLGEYPGIRKIYVEHALEAARKMEQAGRDSQMIVKEHEDE